VVGQWDRLPWAVVTAPSCRQSSQTWGLALGVEPGVGLDDPCGSNSGWFMTQNSLQEHILKSTQVPQVPDWSISGTQVHSLHFNLQLLQKCSMHWQQLFVPFSKVGPYLLRNKTFRCCLLLISGFYWRYVWRTTFALSSLCPNDTKKTSQKSFSVYVCWEPHTQIHAKELKLTCS